ncbi:MAG: hypothetical protein ACYTGB_16750 [Planctomycetota bacterium]|jgi:hypothetical protein
MMTELLSLRLFRVIAACVLLALSAGAIAPPARAGAIDKIKDGIRENKDDKDEKRHKGGKKHKDDKKHRGDKKQKGDRHGLWADDEDDDDWDDEDDWGWEDVVMIVVIDTVLLPLSFPPAMVGDDWERTYRFENYPYRRRGSGYVRVTEPLTDPDAPPEDVRKGEEVPPRSSILITERFGDRPRYPGVKPDVSIRPTYSFERHSSDLRAHRAELLVRTNMRLNFDFEATDYAEDVPGGTDHMQMYNWHLGYSFAVSPRVHFSAGVGWRHLVFEDGYIAEGPDFRYEAEFFPKKPFHLHFIAEGGRVEESSAWELEARAGIFVYKRFQVFVGYRHFRVAGVDLKGPTAGVSLWF